MGLINKIRWFNNKKKQLQKIRSLIASENEGQIHIPKAPEEGNISRIINCKMYQSSERAKYCSPDKINKGASIKPNRNSKAEGLRDGK